MDFLGTILWPIKWVVEAILVAFHTFWTTIGLDPDAGGTWVLSIVGLVLVIRAALIPIFVRQIKSQRKMLEVAPQLKKIQDKYKGKKDAPANSAAFSALAPTRISFPDGAVLDKVEFGDEHSRNPVESGAALGAHGA